MISLQTPACMASHTPAVSCRGLTASWKTELGAHASAPYNGSCFLEHTGNEVGTQLVVTFLVANKMVWANVTTISRLPVLPPDSIHPSSPPNFEYRYTYIRIYPLYRSITIRSDLHDGTGLAVACITIVISARDPAFGGNACRGPYWNHSGAESSEGMEMRYRRIPRELELNLTQFFLKYFFAFWSRSFIFVLVYAKLKKVTFLPPSRAMPPAIFSLEQKLLEVLGMNRMEKEGRLRLLDHWPPTFYVSSAGGTLRCGWTMVCPTYLQIATTCCLVTCAITQTITRYFPLLSSNKKIKIKYKKTYSRYIRTCSTCNVLHSAGAMAPLPTACTSNFDFSGFRHEHVIHSVMTARGTVV